MVDTKSAFTKLSDSSFISVIEQETMEINASELGVKMAWSMVAQ